MAADVTEPVAWLVAEVEPVPAEALPEEDTEPVAVPVAPVVAPEGTTASN